MTSYIGGKSKIGRWITTFYPKDIEIYLEPFGGLFWCFYRMDLDQYPNLKRVVYNDFNPLNTNVFNCVRHYKEFYEVIKHYESQKSDLFYQFQKEVFDPNFKVNLDQPDYHTAAKYIYLLTQVWSGTNCEKGKFIDLKGKYTSKFDSFKKKLIDPEWQAHFNRITDVENLDFEDVIKKYDGPGTYIYVDPPYYMTEKYYVNHDFGLDTHERLAKTLVNMTGKFSLSYYDFPQLSEWFPKDKFHWESKNFAKAAMAKAGKKQSKGTELLIMNY